MLRFNSSIRLNALDNQLYARVAGKQMAVPTTVDDYNRRLELAADICECQRR